METDEKTGRIKVSISMHQDDIDLLNKLAEAVGVNKSELIRRMCKKFSNDKYGIKILRKGTITSHNVHYVDKKSATAEPGSDGDSSSTESTENIPQNTETDNYELMDELSALGITSIQEAAKILKTPSYDFQ